MTKLAIVVALVLLAAWAPSPASASSGQLTRAFADAAWTSGSLAGSVTWDECSGTCSWIPFVSMQPALPSYSCLGTELLDSDPNTVVAWNGASHSVNETIAFDLPSAPILAGVVGQRACVSVFKTVQVREPVCVAQAPILGYDPSTCPLVNRYFGVPLTSSLLTVPPPPSPGGQGTPPPASSDPRPAPRRTTRSPSRQQQLRSALRACTRKRTRAKRRACRNAAQRRYGPRRR